MGYDITQQLSPMDIIYVKSQILFSGENKKNIPNFSSAELDQRVVKVKSKLT